VLCGSEKFPVKEPFVELLKTSMNTFLNAMTYPDKTLYPVSSRIEQDYDGAGTLSMPYSPGYCNWDIREQHLLFSLFPERPCGVILSETSLMAPEKSVSGFFALGEKLQRQPYHCQICKNSKCYKRRKG
jgi:cobalamin-dependent methionine synthase I